jgi:hypothetical protein
MVNYDDPTTIAKDSGAYAIPSGSGTRSPIYKSISSTEAVVKLWLLMDGVYM